MSFLTLEDINTTSFNNQGCYWYTIDLGDITEGTEDLNEVKIDFCKVTRTKTESGYEFFVKVDTSNWIGYAYSLFITDFVSAPIERNGGLKFTTPNNVPSLRLYFYLGPQEHLGWVQFYIVNPVLSLNLKELSEEHTIRAINWYQGREVIPVTRLLDEGYNDIRYNNTRYGYLLVNLLKTDFQFECTDNLYLGKVNTVQLGTDTDYKPNGDLIGNYTPVITVEYKDKTLPVTWDNTLNDYTFQLDLTNEADLNKVKFNVKVESNKVLNHTITEVTLPVEIETITTLNELKTLFRNGGIGKLGANFTNLQEDLTVTANVSLTSNEYHFFRLNEHKIIIEENITFKANSIGFNEGKNAIYQKTGSIVELTDCDFGNNFGVGSCIKCDIDLESLDNPNDFTTILTDCNFTDNNLCILHGGDLIIENCTVNTYLHYSNADTNVNTNYPYFLYQTDGKTQISNSRFNIETQSTGIEIDIGFNPCIFICGETATINGLSHTELQNNNLTSFIENNRNSSSIDLTYYYDAIEDYITLQSSNGYCHSVSGVDYVFKTNILITRSG